MGAIQWQYVFNPQLAIDSFPFVLQGIGYTLLIAVVSMTIGMILGLFLSLARMSKSAILRIPARCYISLMRGTPMLVILFILYFGFPFIGIQFKAVTAALIGFSLNSAAYLAEVNRAAIGSVDKGQWEAAYALGMPYGFILKKIILPQAIRVAMPAMGNIMLDMIKATSLAAMITVPEIFQQAKIVGGREFDYMTMYILVALIYWAICTLFSVGQQVLERKFSAYDPLSLK
ncbi:amino acid ABC transporter permease [Isobaculum melis]|uniref:Amino acid ABC transporter membrane protein, PAAT family n=1 Tax=Isobaculum melis TaxID=142588 RepID=A0A1H9S7T0_9LACT|nr:amino acid ABC transporter permease [Isobaculum melis]SER81034.1 amino acid ABC transporter membrane protein, PAAT family [Isobaculum melis]